MPMEWRCYRWNCPLAPPGTSWVGYAKASRKVGRLPLDLSLLKCIPLISRFTLERRSYTVSYFRMTLKISLIITVICLFYMLQVSDGHYETVPCPDYIYSTMIWSVAAGLRTWNLRWCWPNCWLLRAVSLAASWLRWFILVGQFSNGTTFAVIQTVLRGCLRKLKKGEASLTLNSY